MLVKHERRPFRFGVTLLAGLLGCLSLMGCKDEKTGAQAPTVPAVEVAVLVTKNQLSDLHDQLQTIIDNAERTKKTDSNDFFQGILSASTRMSRDPSMPTQGKTLAQLGGPGVFCRCSADRRLAEP